MRSVVRDTRAGRALAEHARMTPVPGSNGNRGRYEACFTEVARLLEMLRAPEISDQHMRTLTIRMAKLQGEMKLLQSAVNDLTLLADQVVEAVVRRTS